MKRKRSYYDYACASYAAEGKAFHDEEAQSRSKPSCFIEILHYIERRTLALLTSFCKYSTVWEKVM